jgi:hypothetical protein
MTSYVPPIIEVYQEFKTAGALVENPQLQGVVIGPNYHIQTYADDKDSIYVADYDSVSGNVFFAPNAKPGMKLKDDTFLVLMVDDASVEIDTQTDGAYVSGSEAVSDILTSATADWVTAGVKVGDDVRLESDTAEIFVYKVLEVVDANTLRLNKNIEYAASEVSLDIDISRLVDDKEITDTHYAVDTGLNQVTLNIGVTVDEDGLKPLLSGKLYLAYRALDITHANVATEISESDDVSDKLGVISGDDNPLAMGAFVTFNNAQKKIFALALESDDLIGWGKAVDEVKRRGYYAKAILSQDPAIISLFKVLEEANQDPKKAKYGISVGTHKVEELEELEVSSGATGETLTDTGTGLKITFQDNNADFDADDVAPGDEINFTTAPLNAGNPWIVDSVVNANKLKIVTTTEFTSLETAQSYTIDRVLDEQQLAERIAAVSESFGHKRVVMAFPDYCQIAGDKLPGYYMTCVVVGMIAGLPPNAGLTYKGAAVVERVFNSNFRFDDDQLNIIAGGGTLIFMQDDEASLPYIRHQLTTDRTTLESSEISAIKNNDYVSFVFKETMRKFLGIYNVQEGLFVALRPALQGNIHTLEEAISNELGPILIEGEIIELKQSEEFKDQVEAVIDTVQPAPFNRGILRILA